MKLESGKFEVRRNIFDASSHVECIGLQGTSEFDHNNFDGGGIYLHGSNNTFALLNHNTFKNGQTALTVEQLTARLDCNEFRTNDKAIDIVGNGGVVVREYNFKNGHSYPLEGLAPGVYTVTVKGVNDTEYHSMLIIE